jgi:hypothetical protein
LRATAKSIAFYLVLATLTVAAPLQDVSVTSIDLAENTYNAKGDELLFVTVTRVDDLIDDDGSLLAERVMAVRVTFDVFENQVEKKKSFLHILGFPKPPFSYLHLCLVNV